MSSVPIADLAIWLVVPASKIEQNRSLLRTPKGYKAHQDITFNSVMANIHNDNILHTQICSKAQY